MVDSAIGDEGLHAASASAAELEATRAINQGIFDNSPDLILVADCQGNFIRVSPSSLAVIGYTPAEMAGAQRDRVRPSRRSR